MSAYRLAIAALLLPVVASSVPEGLIDKLAAIAHSNDVAAVGLVWVDQDEISCATSGLADRAADREFSCDDYVRIGSVSKLFAGLAMLQADARGLVNLEAALTNPPVVNRWAPERRTTIAQLLEHTAGLGDMTAREFAFNDPVSLEDALAVDPESRRLRWPPGLQSSYSNTGAGVAAWAFEEQTGQDFERWVEQSVFAPTGLESATYDQIDLADGLIVGYDTDGKTPIKYWHTLYRPFGGINIRLSDMGKMVSTLIQRGVSPAGIRAFEPLLIDRLETPETSLAARAGLEFGYGKGIYHYIVDGHMLLGHGGDADGYLGFLGYHLASQRGYYLLINAYQKRTLRAMRRVVESEVVEGIEPDFYPPTPQPASSLAALAGSYDSSSSRFGRGGGEAIVQFENGRLWLSANGSRQVLLPMGDDQFRRRFEPVATIAFVRERGVVYLQGPMGNFQRTEAR